MQEEALDKLAAASSEEERKGVDEKLNLALVNEKARNKKHEDARQKAGRPVGTRRSTRLAKSR